MQATQLSFFFVKNAVVLSPIVSRSFKRPVLFYFFQLKLCAFLFNTNVIFDHRAHPAVLFNLTFLTPVFKFKYFRGHSVVKYLIVYILPLI